MYPAEARAAGARGNVTLMITLDELGRVAEARRIHLSMRSSNPPVSLTLSSSNTEDEKNFLVNRSREQSDAVRAIAAAFTDAAVRAVQQWRYDPPAAGPISFPVTMSFSENHEAAGMEGAVASSAGSSSSVQVGGALRVGGNVRTPIKLRDVRPIYPPEAQAARVSGMVIAEVQIGADGSVEDARILKSIPLLDQAALDAITQWRFKPTLLNGRPVPVMMTVTVNFTLDKSQFVPREGIEVVPEPQGRAALSTLRVWPNRMPQLIKEVKPIYPAEARAANLQGTVEVKATIGTDGKVTDVRVVRSSPMLDEAAIAAVRQWEFTPVPEPVAVDIELSFTTRRQGR
jgi:TonB family protein